MIDGLLVLLTCQLAGEVATRALHLRLPGPVVGMLLLLALLAWRRPAPEAPVVRAADGLLDHLPLLFVPAGAGIVTTVPLLRADWLPLAAGLVLPWAAGLMTTAGTAALVLRHTRRAVPAGDPRELVEDAERMDGMERDA